MSASNEWEIQYLTDSGWVIGGYRLDSGERKKDSPPPNAVLVMRRHVTVGVLGIPSSMKVEESRTNLIQDEDKINRLIAKYGEAQFGV